MCLDVSLTSHRVLLVNECVAAYDVRPWPLTLLTDENSTNIRQV